MIARREIADTFRIPDELWERVQLFLPRFPRKKTGRPRLDPRKVVDGIFYILRTGCQWKAAPPEVGSGSTLHDYFQEFVERGFFRKLWEAGLFEYECLKGIKWDWQSIDGAMTKAPLGGEKDGPQPHGPGEIGHEALHPYGWRRRSPERGGRRREHARQAPRRSHA
jgi:putative transposase